MEVDKLVTCLLDFQFGGCGCGIEGSDKDLLKQTEPSKERLFLG